MLRGIASAYRDNPEYYTREVNRINLCTLYLLPMIGIPASIFNIVAHAIMMQQASQRNGYLLLAYYVFILILTRCRPKKDFRRGTLYIYLVQVPVYIMTILSGTVLDPKYQALTFLLYILAFPPFILDRPIRVIGYSSFWMLLMLALSFCCKERTTFRGDLMHVIQVYCLLLGTIMVILDSRYKLLMRQLEIIRFSEGDELTGLLNRKYFVRNAERRIKSGEEEGDLFFLSLDIKNMCRYNEICGYTEGNYLLMRIAARLKKEFPKGLVSRFDEDHFYVMSGREETDQALMNLTENPLVGSTGKEVQMKIGVYPYVEGDAVGTACDRASIACKNTQKGKLVRWYNRQLKEDYEFRQYLLDHFQDALKEEEFVVYYQPIVRLYSGETCSEEALVRWIDKTRGMISPGQFIPLLEENNLSADLDLYVIRHVVQEFAIKRESGLVNTPVSVNLSRMDFISHDMPALISEILEESHIPHDRLIIEITESSFAMGNELLTGVLNEFHRRGFRVWMDDFGSGYSSLNLLAEFRFDMVKFDMRFVRNLAEGSTCQMILEKMVELVDSLGIGTLIEGVENPEQRELLRQIGGQRIQGYLYSKPRPLSQIIWNAEHGGELVYENPERAQYYDDISKVSLRKPLQFDLSNESGGKEVELPAEVIEIDRDENIRILRMNDRHLMLNQTFGLVNEKGEQDMSVKPKAEFVAHLRQAEQTKVWESVDSEFNPYQNRSTSLFIHYISEDRLTGNVAFLLVVV